MVKIKLRFGKDEYWTAKEGWQQRINRANNIIIVLAIITIIPAIANKNYVGAGVFIGYIALLMAPKKASYKRWEKNHLYKKYGVKEKDGKNTN